MKEYKIEIVNSSACKYTSCSFIENMNYYKGIFHMLEYNDDKFTTNDSSVHDCRETLAEAQKHLKWFCVSVDKPSFLIKCIKRLEKHLKIKNESKLHLGIMDFIDYSQYNLLILNKPYQALTVKQVIIKPSKFWMASITRFSFLTAFVKAIALKRKTLKQLMKKDGLKAITELKYFRQTKQATLKFLKGYTKINNIYTIYHNDKYYLNGWVRRFKHGNLNGLKKP